MASKRRITVTQVSVASHPREGREGVSLSRLRDQQPGLVLPGLSFLVTDKAQVFEHLQSPAGLRPGHRTHVGRGVWQLRLRHVAGFDARDRLSAGAHVAKKVIKLRPDGLVHSDIVAARPSDGCATPGTAYASDGVLYGVYVATAPLIVLGAFWAGRSAVREDWPSLGMSIAIMLVAAGSAFAGPRGVWLSDSVGCCVALLAYSAAQAWLLRGVRSDA